MIQSVEIPHQLELNFSTRVKKVEDLSINSQHIYTNRMVTVRYSGVFGFG